MNRDFAEFCKYFKEYQKLFGLTGYKIYFKYEPIDSFAKIIVNHPDMVVTVKLNNKLLDEDKPFKDVKCSAKHEALHLLLSKLEDRATYRYATKTDIDEAVEELVFKLEDLIPNVRDTTTQNKAIKKLG